MKISFFLSLVFLLSSSFLEPIALSFEGTVKYSVKISGKEANKASGMMPSGYTILIKGNNSLIKTEGGMSMMMGDLLFSGNQQKSYLINHSQKTAFSLEGSSAKTEEEAPSVEKTEEKKVILGYNCTKYLLKEKEGAATQTFIVWATKDLALPKSKTGSGVGFGSFSFEGIEGLPLYVITQMGDLTMEITAINIEKKALPDGQFQLPANYAVKSFDNGSLGGAPVQR